MRGAGRYAAAAVSLVLAGAVGLGGCGTASPESPPSGVDELVVPTPTPDPADFVGGVDNPWLALRPGATWTYDGTGALAGTTTVTVVAERETIAGVATTAVRRAGPDGLAVVDHVAQDREGNVWWFGRDGEWRAGVAGAQAGLLMPATPRRGDGWRAAYDGAGLDVRVTVTATGDSVSTPAGRFADLVALEVTGAGGPGVTTELYYARGTGLVQEVTTEGPVALLRLASAP